MLNSLDSPKLKQDLYWPAMVFRSPFSILTPTRHSNPCQQQASYLQALPYFVSQAYFQWRRVLGGYQAKNETNNPTSILYFQHIHKQFQKATAYKQAAHLILNDEDKYTDHLTEQTHSISKVAN